MCIAVYFYVASVNVEMSVFTSSYVMQYLRRSVCMCVCASLIYM